MFGAYAQDPAVTRYLTWRPHGDIAETRAVIDRFLAAWERQDEFCWLIFTSDAGEMIGSIGARTEDDGFNLGFLLARSHWGRGYVPEAITAVVDWAFTQPWVSQVWAACECGKPFLGPGAGKGWIQPRGRSTPVSSSSQHLVSSSRLLRIFSHSQPLTGLRVSYRLSIIGLCR